MKPLDILKLSTGSFRSRFSRTAFTIFGVAIGIGAILFFVSFGNGLQKIILERITTDEALLSLDVFPPASGIIELDSDSISALENIEHIEHVSLVASIPSQISIGGLNADVLVNAVGPEYFKLSVGDLRAGGVAELNDKQSNEDGVLPKIVVSEALVVAFDISPKQAIGEQASFVFFLPKQKEEGVEEVEEIEIFTRETPYEIVGVIDEEVAPIAYIPLSSVADLPITKYSQAKVKVDKDDYIVKVRDTILGQGFIVLSLAETVEQANKIFNVIQITLFVFGVIALIVAAVGLINTMTIAILERTNEIGIMRAVGASSRDVRIIFLAESTIIGFLGGVSGVILGIIAGEIFGLGVNILARTLGAQSLDLFVYPLWFIFFILILSSAVGFLGGIWPARRAAMLDPLAALRYK